MKAKVKFDSAQLKAFFLHHVEKIVFTGFIIAFLMICAAAFKLKPYEKTPAELKAVADKISQEVEKNAPPEKFVDLASVPNFSNLGAVGPAPVDSRFYAVRPLSLPYELRQASRKEPKFFALEDVLPFPGYGGIAISENGGAQRLGNFGDGGAMGGANVMDSSQMTPGSAMASGMPPPDMMPSGPTSSGGPGAGGMAMPGMGGGMPGPSSGSRPRGNRRTAKKAAPKKKEPTPVARPPKPRSTEKIVITQPPSGSQVVGRYWVCLVGAIPYSKQLGDYQNTFRDARFYDVKRDYPRYSWPIIERAEVNRGGVGDWQQLDVEAAMEDLSKWAVEYPDVIDPRFKSELTEPLPPLIFANHDKQKVNHPRTKIVEKAKAAEEAGPKKKTKPRTLSGTAARARGGNPSAMSGGNSGGMPSGYAGPDSYGAGAAGMGAGGMGAPIRRAGPVVEHRLFRFFDFDVEPGKTYRYRIKLVLVNPNADVPPRFLESYDFGKGATREADWSPVSPEVTVIAGNRLLAGNVSVAPGKGEPAGKILAKLFDATEAAEIRRVFDVNRGSVLNEHQVEVGLPDPSGGKGNRSATVDFETNAVVLDLFGGEKLPGVRNSNPRKEAPKVPGHILVLDNDGEIKVLLQSDDAGVYETEEEESKNQVAPEKKEEAQRAESGSSRGFDNFDELDTGKKKRRP